MIERVRIGHLAFGLAFVVIGLSWLGRDTDDWVHFAWLVVVSGFALGLAGLVTVLFRLFR